MKTLKSACKPRDTVFDAARRDTVVVVSANESGKLSWPRGSLVDFFRKSPLVGVKLDLDRSRDTRRRRHW